MKRNKLLLSVLFMALWFNANAQISASLNGYVSNMQSAMFEKFDGSWVNDNLLHNRLNFKLFLGSKVTFNAEARNRFLWGETVKYFPGYADMLDKDPGWQDMSWNILSDSSYILNSSIDRVYFDINLGDFQLTAGRQRINWGMNYVWNPNDLFNNYSFFDFDYVERPGSDAVRLQYYFDYSTHVELVGKMNHLDQYSIAGLFRFNALGYDFQVLSGIINEEEYAFGAGFSGNLGPVSLSGEITYLDPIKENDPRSSVTLAGAGASYYTPFQLYFQVEYLYNGAADADQLGNFNDFYYRNLSLRDLSFTPHTFFGNISYPITPLINSGVAFMYMPQLNGYFAGPSLDISVCQNLDFSFIWQHFSVDFTSGDSQKITLGFLRLKWNF